MLAMASSQTRIAETISLFYTADRASDVSLLRPMWDYGMRADGIGRYGGTCVQSGGR